MRAIDGDELLKVTVKRNGIWNAITNSSGEGLEEIINNQPTIEIPGWIPCKERLPEESGEYYITIDYGSIHSTDLSWFYPKDQTWSYKNANVIAWMPLPEPYKEEHNADK